MATPYRLRGHKPTSGGAAAGILGPVVKTYCGATSGHIVVAAAPFVLLLAYGVWLAHQGQLMHWFNSTFSMGAVTALFLLSIVLIVRTATGGGGEIIRLHVDGILDLRAGPRAVRWDEMEELTAVATTDGRGVRRHTLRTADGATLALGASIGQVDDLVEEIRLKMVEREVPAVRARIAVGDVVHFGAMAASAEGLVMGGRVLPWSAVGDLEAEGGEIVVKTTGGERWAVAKLEDVPNAFVLAELAPARRGESPL
jgi:hypothetical protein